MKANKTILVLGALALTAMALCPAVAVTVDSSYGWNATYVAANTVNGVFGSSDMGMTDIADAWVIYDFGAATTVSKLRITAPLYGGSGQDTYNPTAGSVEFSNDKVAWTSPIAWSAPKLESIVTTDYSESAMPEAMDYRYMRFNIATPGRIGEIWFVEAPQVAIWEMNQNSYYTNTYPAWKTVDGLWVDGGSFGVISGDPGGWGSGYVTYDLGLSQIVYGFDMMARRWAGLNPQGGELWVSDDPVNGYTKVGNWTLPDMADYATGTVNFGVASGLAGRYVQLRNFAVGDQYSEIQFLTADVPEPGSILALGSGLIGLAGFALRRRSR